MRFVLPVGSSSLLTSSLAGLLGALVVVGATGCHVVVTDAPASDAAADTTSDATNDDARVDPSDADDPADSTADGATDTAEATDATDATNASEVSDSASDDATDASDVTDASDGATDSASDAEASDSVSDASDAAPTFGVVVRATDLIGGAGSIQGFGGGSTRLEIEGGQLAYAYAVWSGKIGDEDKIIESSRIDKNDDGSLTDGRLVGLPVGVEQTLVVTAYLRGLDGNGIETPTARIPWARVTCKATPSATADVIATCPKLELIPDLNGIVFSSDVLPAGYCDGKGKAEFSVLRAQAVGATTSKSTSDCRGVVWIPSSEFVEVAGVSTWTLGMQPKSGSACTLKAPGCVVNRGGYDVFVVGDMCKLTNDSTGGACF